MVYQPEQLATRWLRHFRSVAFGTLFMKVGNRNWRIQLETMKRNKPPLHEWSDRSGHCRLVRLVDVSTKSARKLFVYLASGLDGFQGKKQFALPFLSHKDPVPLYAPGRKLPETSKGFFLSHNLAFPGKQKASTDLLRRSALSNAIATGLIVKDKALELKLSGTAYVLEF